MAEQHGSGEAKTYSRPHLAGSSQSIRGHSLRYRGTSGLLLLMSLGNIHFPSKPFIYLHRTLNILVHGAAAFDVRRSLRFNPERSPPPPSHSCPIPFTFIWEGGLFFPLADGAEKEKRVESSSQKAKGISQLRNGCLLIICIYLVLRRGKLFF